MKPILRKIYLDKIKPFLGKQMIKLIVGMRRVGKSYFLRSLADYITENYDNTNIIFIDKENEQFFDLTEAKQLLDYVNKHYKKDKSNFILIDEAQEIAEFEKALRILINKENTDVICTGSNSKFFSSELSTLLSGRFIEIKIFPLSYSEFLEFHKLADSEDSFDKYLTFGGLPYLMNLKLEQEIAFEYLKNVYNTIILNDVIKRYNIKNAFLLDSIMRFFAFNFSKQFSAKKIADTLKYHKISTSPKVILQYLDYLQSAFAIRTIRRFDIKGRELFQFQQKVFFTDVGIRNSTAGYQQSDIEKILENIVLNHLLINGYEVYYGKIADREIDFVAQKNNKTIYIQVAYLIADDKTFEREFGNLLKINDNYPKYVLSLTPNPQDYKGIKHLNVRKFLLQTQNL